MKLFLTLVALLFLEESLVTGGEEGSAPQPKKLSNEELKKVEESPGFKVFQLCNKCLFDQAMDDKSIQEIVKLSKSIPKLNQDELHARLEDLQKARTTFGLRRLRYLVKPNFYEALHSELYEGAYALKFSFLNVLRREEEDVYDMYNSSLRLQLNSKDPTAISNFLASVEEHLKNQPKYPINVLNRLKAHHQQKGNLELLDVLRIQEFLLSSIESTFLNYLKEKTGLNEAELYHNNFLI